MKIVLTVNDIFNLICLIGLIIFGLWVFISVKNINRKNKKKGNKRR